jgi:hypothetical protein
MLRDSLSYSLALQAELEALPLGDKHQTGNWLRVKDPAEGHLQERKREDMYMGPPQNAQFRCLLEKARPLFRKTDLEEQKEFE